VQAVGVEQTLARLRNDIIRLEICVAAIVALNKRVPDYGVAKYSHIQNQFAA
jgi:hypothetical protein